MKEDNQKILITGGTGFIGQSLIPALLEKGYLVTVLSRSSHKVLRLFGNSVTAVESLSTLNNEFDIVINLAGEPIAEGRWTKSKKSKLYKSRVALTEDLVQVISTWHEPPSMFISGSAIGFYGTHPTEVFTEDSQPASHDLAQDLCQKWESAALQAQSETTRVCLLRFGLVLGINGGILKRLRIPFQLGTGTILGDGQQFMSWIHIEDVIAVILYLIENKSISGPINMTAPQAVSNRRFSQALGDSLKRPVFLKMPAGLVKLLFGEMGEVLLLQGQNVVPAKLTHSGFNFHYSMLDEALNQIFKVS